MLIEEHRHHYNHRRPQSTLGCLALAEFASSCLPVAVGVESGGEECKEELEFASVLSYSWYSKQGHECLTIGKLVIATLLPDLQWELFKYIYLTNNV